MAEPIRPGKGESPLNYVLRINAASLDEAAKDLDQGIKDLQRVQRKVYGEISRKVVGWARFDAAGGTPRQRRYANRIVPRATASVARMSIQNFEGAQATFWGAKKRTGWYARKQFSGIPTRQHPAWVGASWTAGERGEGPYVINDAIADNRTQIDEMVLNAHAEVIRRSTGGGRF